MILDCKFAITDGTGHKKLLALIDSNVSFSFISSSVAKCLYWAIKPNNTTIAVKLAYYRTVVRSLDIVYGLVSHGI